MFNIFTTLLNNSIAINGMQEETSKILKKVRSM
jgi:hypothetical protein